MKTIKSACQNVTFEHGGIQLGLLSLNDAVSDPDLRTGRATWADLSQISESARCQLMSGRLWMRRDKATARCFRPADRSGYRKSHQPQCGACLLIGKLEIQRDGVVVVQPDRKDWQPLSHIHWRNRRSKMIQQRHNVSPSPYFSQSRLCREQISAVTSANQCPAFTFRLMDSRRGAGGPGVRHSELPP